MANVQKKGIRSRMRDLTEAEDEAAWRRFVINRARPREWSLQWVERIVKDDPELKRKDIQDELLAMVMHPDERYMATIVDPVTWEDYYGSLPPDPFLCWLAEKGWLDPTKAFKYQLNNKIVAGIWENACEAAWASQREEGVILNPRGIAVLKAYDVGKRWVDNHEAYNDGENEKYGLLKDPRALEVPLGPGFSAWKKEFIEWIEDQDEEMVAQLSYLPVRVIRPLVLKYSKLAATEKGLATLTGMMVDADKTLLDAISANKHLDPESPGLVDWAVGEVEGESGDLMEAAQEFWQKWGESGKILPEPFMDRIRFHIKEHGISCAHAYLPDVYRDDGLRRLLLKESWTDGKTIALKYLKGQEWLATTLDLDKERNADEEWLAQMIREVRKDQLVGLTRQDFIPLMRSERKVVRVEIARAIGMVDSKPSIGRQNKKTQGR